MDSYRNSQEMEYYQHQYEDKSKYGVGISFYSLTGVFIILILCLLFSSCRSVKYISVPEYHYETIVKTDTFVSRDSIFFKDSVFVMKNGDTVTIDRTKYIYKDRWKEVVRVDSFVKTDSIRVPYPVERQLTKWQQLKQDIGGFMIILSALSIIVILCLLIFRGKN